MIEKLARNLRALAEDPPVTKIEVYCGFRIFAAKQIEELEAELEKHILVYNGPVVGLPWRRCSEDSTGDS